MIGEVSDIKPTMWYVEVPSYTFHFGFGVKVVKVSEQDNLDTTINQRFHSKRAISPTNSYQANPSQAPPKHSHKP
jgi:hypothetical protein